MSLILDPVATRALLGVEFCPVCKQDTLPLASGICAWCSTPLTGGKPKVVPAPNGRCEYCDESLSETNAPNKSKRRFCSDSHRAMHYYRTKKDAA